MDKPQKIVLDTKGIGEGGTAYMFVAAENSLRELSGAIGRLAGLSEGSRIDFRVCVKHKPENFVSLAFAKCSESKLEQLRQPGRLSRFKSLIEKLVPGSIFVLLPAIFLVGLYHSILYLGQAILWLLSVI
jgi:hypothetical protein